MPHFLMPISRTFTPTFDLLVSSAFALFKFFLAYLGMHLDKQAYLGLSSFCFGYLFCIMFSISPYYARLHIAYKNQALMDICKYFEFDISKWKVCFGKSLISCFNAIRNQHRELIVFWTAIKIGISCNNVEQWRS